MQQNQAKPPIINFEKRPVEDRDASLKAGYRVCKDIDYIIIIPHGSGGKTRMEYVFEEWKARIQRECDSGDEYNPSRFPREWLERVIAAHDAWTKGQELPVDGTPVKNWPAISPAQALNCEAAGYPTVELLAIANEEGVQRLGMGGRALVQKAQAYVQVKTEPAAQVAGRLEAMEAELKLLREQNASLSQKLAKAEAEAEEE